jgi:hypothetical protein
VSTDDLPVQNASATIIQDGQLVPDWFLQAHLTRLGLSPVTDGGGRLSLVGLRPGVYEVFLNGLLTHQGHVARLALESGSRSEYTVVTRSGDSR